MKYWIFTLGIVFACIIILFLVGNHTDVKIPIEDQNATFTSTNVLNAINNQRALQNVAVANQSYSMSAVAQGLADDVVKNGCSSLNMKDKIDNGTVKESWGYVTDCNHSTTSDLIESLMSSPAEKQILMNPTTRYLGVGVNGSAAIIFISRDPADK